MFPLFLVSSSYNQNRGPPSLLTANVARIAMEFPRNTDILPLRQALLFGVKDPIPGGLRSRVVYKFACAGCNACYVGETTRHFSTRVHEHLVSDMASHIFKHLENSEHCHDLCSVDCFHILDHASTTFQLTIKEAFHIRREKPSLNQQLHHVNLKLSL